MFVKCFSRFIYISHINFSLFFKEIFTITYLMVLDFIMQLFVDPVGNIYNSIVIDTSCKKDITSKKEQYCKVMEWWEYKSRNCKKVQQKSNNNKKARQEQEKNTGFNMTKKYLRKNKK